MKKLPVNINTFAELQELNYLYVDKTEYLYNLITRGRRYFLSRPRRFGKSLLISTLKEILSGNKQLFHGLWINSSDYEWKEYGVINLDFSLFHSKTVEIFKKDLCEELYRIADSYGITMQDGTDAPHSLLKNLFMRFLTNLEKLLFWLMNMIVKS